MLNAIFAKFGKDNKAWDKDFKLIVNDKVSHLASIIDLIKHLHIYQIKHTPTDVLDIYIRFLNTIGYPLTNVTNHAMKERMKQYFPSFKLAKKRKLSDDSSNIWLTLSDTP